MRSSGIKLVGTKNIATLLAAMLCCAGQSFAASHAYVSNEKSGTVSVIETATGKVIDTLPATGKIGEKIQKAMTDTSGKTLFVADAEGGQRPHGLDRNLRGQPGGGHGPGYPARGYRAQPP